MRSRSWGSNRIMRVELIAIGSELVRFGRRDTNSDWLTGRLEQAGIEVAARSLVEDDEQPLAATIAAALARADVVLLTGGLGPTDDDRTRAALARALERPLERDPQQLESLRARYARFERRLGEVESSQADRPRGAAWIENPLGSAAGLLVDEPGRFVAALPGVPSEMKAMFDAALFPLLAARAEGSRGTCTLRIAGRTESGLERALHDLYRAPGLDVTILGGLEGVELHARAVGESPEQVAERLATFEQAVRERIGLDVYGVGEQRLAEVVGRLLADSGRTVASAESCTGGLLGGALTAVPGSSAWYRGGCIVYSDPLKRSLAGVGERTLAEHGAVSREVAEELARGVRERCAADLGIGITGIAGPGGGSEEKPVGLVHLALADSAATLHRELRLIGDREAVRARTVTVALDQLRRRLLERA